MGEFLTSHIPTNFNLSGVLTKILFGKKSSGMVEGLMFDVFD